MLRLRRARFVLLVLALVMVPGLLAYVFEPPYTGLRVRIERFETAGFPQVDMFFRLESGDKQDFRYLHPANLRLVEEEVPVRDFDIQLESPAVSLALVLDDSGSIDPELEYLKQAATRFVDELHRLDEVAVVSFDRRARLLQERTTRKLLVKEAIGKLRAYGATAVFDGAVLGLEATRQGKGQRKMLLLTDGNDQTYDGGRPLSLETAQGLIQRARAEGVEIYTIALGHHTDRALLERIAHQTGGQAWYAPQPRHLREVFDAIARSMTARYRLSYVSPNARREKQDRTITLDVSYQHHSGRGVGTYWLDREVPVRALEIQPEKVAAAGPGKMRVYTQGFRGRFLRTEFELYREEDQDELYRAGQTTVDGFGRLDRPDPVLVDLAPGTYRLRLEVPGQPLAFEYPGIEVAAGETVSRRVAFSKVVFYRDGEPWYDLPHPYGETSDLIWVEIGDALVAASRKIDCEADPEACAVAETSEVRLEGRDPDCDLSPEECSALPYAHRGKSKEELFRGYLSELEQHREMAVWLPEGVYDISMDNRWKDAPDPEAPVAENAPLSKRLLAESFQVLGGIELRFDVPRDAFAMEEDVLSPEYDRLHPDPLNPFAEVAPRTREELAQAVASRRDAYLRGDFTRERPGVFPAERSYEYQRSPEEVRARLRELEARYRDRLEAPPADEVDAGWLDRHGYGPEVRERRMEDIQDHYLGETRDSFPDRAGATPRYTGGAGDRFEGVESLRRRHDFRGDPEREKVQGLLEDMRERVAYRERSEPGEGRELGGVDPAEPFTDRTLSDVVGRVGERLRQEYHHHPRQLHNLDALRPAGARATGPGGD